MPFAATPALAETSGGVKTGDPVGHVGCTGSCTAPHLHFEMWNGRRHEGEAVDPLPKLREWDRTS